MNYVKIQNLKIQNKFLLKFEVFKDKNYISVELVFLPLATQYIALGSLNNSDRFKLASMLERNFNNTRNCVYIITSYKYAKQAINKWTRIKDYSVRKRKDTGYGESTGAYSSKVGLQLIFNNAIIRLVIVISNISNIDDDKSKKSSFVCALSGMWPYGYFKQNWNPAW